MVIHVHVAELAKNFVINKLGEGWVEMVVGNNFEA
jgi:hypothetical protein